MKSRMKTQKSKVMKLPQKSKARKLPQKSKARKLPQKSKSRKLPQKSKSRKSSPNSKKRKSSPKSKTRKSSPKSKAMKRNIKKRLKQSKMGSDSDSDSDFTEQLGNMKIGRDSDSDSDSDFTGQLGNMKIGSDSDSSRELEEMAPQKPIPARKMKERRELHKKFLEKQKDQIYDFTNKFGKMGITKTIQKPQSTKNVSVDQILQSMKKMKDLYKKK